MEGIWVGFCVRLSYSTCWTDKNEIWPSPPSLARNQQQVLTNKDLDLPTQQELLAQFRCDEISATVLEAFQAASKGAKRPVESGNVVEGLGGMMGDWKATAIGEC